ncbi:Kinase, NEK [Giardia muris]|uniref:Kinase, NEK n=1 Tax=Giardia muris TaxID=5742 RepID=A0A4Z1T9F0_GIAMU|nr:Kinase, NEK [Giardia muris]|eukprot:TNJ29151.1 Kinase, NEK [Giardia muris]
MSKKELLDAAEINDVEGVKANIEAAKGQDSYGRTALMLAAMGGCIECVNLLVGLENGMQALDGTTALIYAVKKRMRECVELLAPFECTIADNEGKTALMYAAQGGYSECMEILKAERGKQSNTGETALMIAAMYSKPNCIRSLVEYEQGLMTQMGWTALMYAAKLSTAECVGLLLQETGKQTMNKYLGHPTGTTALMIALNLRDVSKVRLLACHEADLKDGDGHDAQWHALKTQDQKVLQTFQEALKAGDIAVIEPKEETLENIEVPSISSNPIEVHLELDESATPLMHDVASGKTLETLVQSRDVGITDNKKQTALMVAASRGYLDALKVLLPTEVGWVDNKGWCALMHACLTRNLDCARLLLFERDLLSSTLFSDLETHLKSVPEAEATTILSLLTSRPDIPTLPTSLDKYRLTHLVSDAPYIRTYGGYGAMREPSFITVLDCGQLSSTEYERVRSNLHLLSALKTDQVIRLETVVFETSVAYLVTETYFYSLDDIIKSHLRRSTTFTEQEIWKCISDISGGLEYLHKNGIVHNGLIPANIYFFLGSGYRLSLPSYAPSDPEAHKPYQAPDGTPTPAADLWSLGAIAYELCMGHPPEGYQDGRFDKVEPSPTRSDELYDLVTDLLASNPEARGTAQKISRVAKRKARSR